MATSVKKLTDAGRSVLTQLMKTYSKQRLNGNALFGQDEFPTDKSIDCLLDNSQAYDVTSQGNPHMSAGYVIISPSVFAPMIADIRVVPATKVFSKEAFPVLLSIASNRAGILGYEGCMYETFLSNQSLFSTARNQGYNTIAILPRCGYVFDQGWQENFVLMKTLRDVRENLPFRPTEPPIASDYPKWGKTFVGDRNFTLSMPVPLKSKNGSQYFCDTAKPEDVGKIHKLYAQAHSLGHGYLKEEIPSEELLLEVITGTSNGHVFVSRAHTETGDIAAAWYVFPSIYARSATPVCCDIYVVVGQRHLRNGLLTANLSVVRKALLQLGYDGQLSDVYVNNFPGIKSLVKLGGTVVGTVPYVSYIAEQGWVDNTLMYCDFRRDFLEEID